jgi:hypothetical protein
VHSPRITRFLALTTLAALAAFVALTVASMAVYPGGTWMDRSAPGHHFWANFFCDLQQPIALNGQPNPGGALLGKLAAFALFASWIPFWIILPRVMSKPRVGAWARVLGVVASVLAIAVPLLPSGRWGFLHTIAIFVAAGPGLAALALGIIGVSKARDAPHLLRASAIALGVSAFADAALYGHHVAFEVPVTIAVPLAQKIAAIFLLLWMSLVVARVLSRRPARTESDTSPSSPP